MRETPEAAAGSPVAVRAHDKLALGVAGSPVLEDKGKVLGLLLRERCRGLILRGLLIGLGLEEGAGVGNGIQQRAEVSRQHVGHEPRDRLGADDNLGSQASGKQETSEDEIYIQLKAGIVKHKVDTALSLAVGTGLLEDLVGGRQIVGEDVVLGLLAGLAALELLDILVGHVGQQREISGVAPEANLKELAEEKLLSSFIRLGCLGLLDELAVARGELEDGIARGAESVDLLAGKQVVALPVCAEREEGANAAVHVALGEEPGDVEPCRVAALLELLVVSDRLFGEAVLGKGAEDAVVLDFVLEGAELLDNLLALGLLLGIVCLADGAIEIVNGAGL